MPRQANVTPPTLEEMRQSAPWLWVWCRNVNCLHRAPMAITPLIIRWGRRVAKQPSLPSVSCFAGTLETTRRMAQAMSRELDAGHMPYSTGSKVIGIFNAPSPLRQVRWLSSAAGIRLRSRPLALHHRIKADTGNVGGIVLLAFVTAMPPSRRPRRNRTPDGQRFPKPPPASRHGRPTLSCAAAGYQQLVEITAVSAEASLMAGPDLPAHESIRRQTRRSEPISRPR